MWNLTVEEIRYVTVVFLVVASCSIYLWEASKKGLIK